MGGVNTSRYVTDFTCGMRSSTMSQIRGNDINPERIVRRCLFPHHPYFRKNDKRHPDYLNLVLPNAPSLC